MKKGRKKDGYIKKSFSMIKYNFKTLFIFDFFYTTLIAMIFIPLVIEMINFTMKITGFNYITVDNIKGFLLNPITIIMAIIVIIFLTVVSMFGITALIIIFDESYHRKKIGVIDLIKLSFKKCIKLFRFKNILVAFLVLFIMPFLSIGVGTNVITSIHIPEFIKDYIVNNTMLSCLFIAAYIFLLILFTKWFYSLHYMVLEEKDFKEARKSSKILIKGNRFKDLLRVLFPQLIITLIYGISIILSITLIYLLYKSLSSVIVLESVLITIIWLFIIVVLVITNVLSTSVSYATLSSLFYKHKIDINEEIISIEYEEKKKNKKKKKVIRSIVLILVTALILIGGTVLTYQIVSGRANLNIESLKKVELTAHRGASIDYPENTMIAFKKAKEFKADYIELDVAQTKDGKIVVSHDQNLGRTAHVNKDIVDMTYDEIKDLDVGSFFNEKFKDERIPLLSEVLEFAKENNMRLNIELKPSGREKDFEKNVIDLINEYDFKDRCYLTSLNYDALMNSKKYDKSIKTGYIMAIAMGDILEVKNVDIFSLEATNVNADLVEKLHNAGKEILIWTVNTEESITNAIKLNVDSIITDDVELGRKLIKENKKTNLLIELAKTFFK